jgi:nicotinate-nucleotide pyrophosphorylase (carboxylating)
MNDSIQNLIDLALAEDLDQDGDITSKAIFLEQEATARIYAKEDLVLSGLCVAQQVFETVNPSLNFQTCTNTGPVPTQSHCDPSLAESQSPSVLRRSPRRFAPRDDILLVSGPLQSLLIAERTALNFLQQLSGIATLTSKFVEFVKGTGVKIRDTRKTIPGFRALSKQAVFDGGGENHRMGLYDQYLIKDNHIDAAGSITECIQQCRGAACRAQKDLKIQVEVRNKAEATEALKAGADSLLLDNMTHEEAREIVNFVHDAVGAHGHAPALEVSGKVTLENVARWAETGVDAISIGALTHSAPAVDIAMEIAR